ncbi:MAG: Rieske 2Fe-2S domain-containing protein, partial [Myxococcales bacterium]|nr:Rieske 2Fe-2S domain-containing protein [Myxococcales bacterium]
MAEEIVRLPLDCLGDGELMRIERPPFNVLLARVDGAYHAITDNCPHAAWSLSEGPLRGHVVTCPGHGWPIDVRTGLVAGSRSIARRCHVYEVRVDDAELVVYDNLPV